MERAGARPTPPGLRSDAVPVRDAVFGAGVTGQRLVRSRLDELFEEGAVVAHRLPQALRGTAVPLVGVSEPVTFAIVLDDQRVVDRDVGSLLLEVVDRIPAVAHDRLDQAVGPRDRGTRLVDELALQNLPALEVPLARCACERPDLELAPTLLARGQLGLGRMLAFRGAHRAVVLRPELAAQPVGPLALERAPNDTSDHERGCNCDQHPDPCGHGQHLLSFESIDRWRTRSWTTVRGTRTVSQIRRTLSVAAHISDPSGFKNSA